MTPDMTPAVARAIEAGQEWARRLGQAETGAEHLLHGLLDEEDGRAVSLMLAAGLNLQAYRQAVHSRIVPHPSAAIPQLSQQAQGVLSEARILAVEINGDRTISSECLLLAVVRQEEALRAALRGHGLRCEQLEESVLGLAGPPIQLDEPLALVDITEQIDAARILDASANRAREALRVIEDYCRFTLDDPLLSGEAKSLRHELSAALESLPVDRLLAGRDTQRDVGTTISTPDESLRYGLTHVVAVNGKRLQEALRSLEEYGKIFSAELGQVMEQLRYRSYTLERALFLGTDARQRLEQAVIHVLLGGSACVHSLEWTIKEAAAGGAAVIQLREKQLNDRDLLERARQVRRWTREAGVLFIVNDRPDIARLVEADGVHLGQEDLPVREARRILGDSALIGVSTHNLGQLRQAILAGASYVGVGPTFASGTKEFEQLAGLEYVRQAMAATTLPAFVIGGINRANLPLAIAAGARRVAVSQAVARAESPRAVVAEFVRLLRG